MSHADAKTPWDIPLGALRARQCVRAELVMRGATRFLPRIRREILRRSDAAMVILPVIAS